MKDNSAAIIIGGAFQGRNGDIEHQFRQESNFYCLTGFKEPDSAAILEKIDGQCRLILIVPPKDPAKETWNGYRAGTRGALRQYGASSAYDNTKLTAVIERVCSQAERIYFLPAITNPATNAKVLRILETHSITPFQIGQDFTRSRMIKTSHEIDLIRHAIFITGKGFERVMKARSSVINEGLLQAEMEFEFRSRGAVHLAFPSIVASGANATTLTLIATKTSTRGFCSASDIFYSGEGKGFALAKTL